MRLNILIERRLNTCLKMRIKDIFKMFYKILNLKSLDILKKDKEQFNESIKDSMLIFKKYKEERNFKILLVLEQNNRVDSLLQVLSNEYCVVVAFNENEIKRYIKNEKFDIVIMESIMPKFSVYELCKNIRKKYSVIELPIIILMEQCKNANILEGFKCGVNDYIRKPFEEIEILMKINTLITMKNAISLSIKDGLTEIFNRRHLLKLAREILKEYKTSNKKFSIIMIDLDYFKKINDNCGHDTGDIVLRKVVSKCNEVIRETDIIGRYGGEEFVILLSNTTKDEAFVVAERIRKSVCEKPIKIKEGCEVEVTLSLGVAEIEDYMQDIKDIFCKADVALYKAKENGRNRTEIAESCLCNKNVLYYKI